MEIIGLGMALGLIAAAACVMCYRRGLSDGAELRQGGTPGRFFGRTASAAGFARGGRQETGRGAGDDEAAAMMKRYETILSYDPYASAQREAVYGGGERA
jgi:hypothetical protein